VICKKRYPAGHIVNGFTLIEVMISLSVFAIALVLLINIFTNCLNALRILQNNTTALYIAEEKMIELELTRNALGFYDHSFNKEFTVGNVDYQWDTDFSHSQEQEGLMKIGSVLSWREGKRKGNISIWTYLRR